MLGLSPSQSTRLLSSALLEVLWTIGLWRLSVNFMSLYELFIYSEDLILFVFFFEVLEDEIIIGWGCKPGLFHNPQSLCKTYRYLTLTILCIQQCAVLSTSQIYTWRMGKITQTRVMSHDQPSGLATGNVHTMCGKTGVYLFWRDKRWLKNNFICQSLYS